VEKRVNPYSECHQTRQALRHVEPEKGAISLEMLAPTLTEPLFKKSRRVSGLRSHNRVSKRGTHVAGNATSKASQFLVFAGELQIFGNDLSAKRPA